MSVATERARPAVPAPPPADGPPNPRRGSVLLVALLALATVLLGAGAALSPVRADDPVLTWPRAGTAPTSTVVPLAAYRPLQLEVVLPATAVAALAARGGGEALRTLPADVPPTSNGPDNSTEQADQGLLVTVDGSGTVQVAASGTTVATVPRAGTGSGPLLVTADADGARVTRDGVLLGAAPGLAVPQVTELETGLDGDAGATGLAATLHVDARYQSSPTPLKVVLLLAHAIALLATLVVARRTWRAPARRRWRVRPSPVDAVVVLLAGAWTVLGPVNIDDSWYALMARTTGAGGFVGNYVNMFDSAENPFVLSQYLAVAWGSLGGWSLWWLRLLPLAYGLGTYLLLRVLLADLLGRAGVRTRQAAALALAFGVWWLPYGITLRPEPLIVLLAAGVLVATRAARRDDSPVALAVAVALAVLALTVSPTGLVAAAPLVVALPWLGRTLRSRGRGPAAAVLAVAVAAATVVVPVGLADATPADVLEATSVRTWYYLRYTWQQEYVHYETLLGGPWLPRLPVLLTLAVLLLAGAAAVATRGGGGRTAAATRGAALTLLVALLLLAPTPSKWVNHFGAVAAPGVLLLALALLRPPLPRRARAGAGLVAAGVVVVATTVALLGPNDWRPFADWGQLFGDHTRVSEVVDVRALAPAVAGVPLSSPVPWLVVALAAVLVSARRRRRGRASGPGADRAVLTAAALTGVVLALVVSVAAPLRQHPGPSLAATNAATAVARLTGAAPDCGLADRVRVDAGDGPVQAQQVLGDAPVFVDQVSAALWPCARLAAVRDGVVTAPEFRVRAGDGLEGAITDNAFTPFGGGTFAGVARTASFVELPSSLNPGGQPTLAWGHVERVVYRHPPGLVDLTVTRTERGALDRLPTLAYRGYAGRADVG
ncbi:hypothetical protein GCM10027047_16200 [Rhodococcus aerolatus]